MSPVPTDVIATAISDNSADAASATDPSNPPEAILTDSNESCAAAINEADSLLADEITAELNDNDALMEAVMNFSLESTDDGKDADYKPEEQSSADSSAKEQKTIMNQNTAKQESKKKSKGPPVRVFRDSPDKPKKSTSPPKNMPPLTELPSTPPKATYQPKNRAPPVYSNVSQHKYFDPRSKPPLLPTKFVPDPRHSYPNQRNFGRPPINHRRQQPRGPRPPRTLHRPSLMRAPLAAISANVPLSWRNQGPPPRPQDPYQAYPQQHPYQFPPHHQHHYPNYHQGNQPFQPPPPARQTPSPLQPPTPQPTTDSPPQPRREPDASPPCSPSSKLDPATGVIRPEHAALVQMHNLGLKVTYAVAWEGGGGVFLTRSEAEVSKTTAAAANTKPKDIFTCANLSCNLFQNEALALNWVLEQNRTAGGNSSSPPPASTPPASSAAHGKVHSTQHADHNTPPRSSNTQEYTTPSPQPPSTPTTSNNNTATSNVPIHNSHTHGVAHSPPPTPTPPRETLLAADEWSFSQEDILVRKCLLNPKFAAISVMDKTPDPNRLPYIAAPGSTKGIIISSSDSGLQNMVIDPTTGTISIKPRHLPTLRLLDFPTFLSLMFRAIDMATRQPSPTATRASLAVRTLIRDLTRQYESLKWANEPDAIWSYTAYLRWTHMIQTRTLCTGFNCEQAFVTEARNRSRNTDHRIHSPHSTPHGTSPLIHASSKNHNHKLAESTVQSHRNVSHWFICPCCAVANDHFSPTCPTQAQGPKPIPKFVQDSTKNAINSAQISQSAKANLLRMASALYAKLDKKL